MADTYNHRVQTWAADGRFLGVWGGKGAAKEQFDVPSGIAIDGNGVVHVADSANHRLVARTTRGKVVAVWELSDHLIPRIHSPTRVAARGANVFVADVANHRVLKLVIAEN